LNNAGKVSAEIAKKLASREYEKYQKIQEQNYVSDFNKETKKYLNT
jgi:hypothetical protein